MKYFEYIGQDREEMSPNGNHYIFSVDLTMSSLSCINLYILNMYAKPLHTGHFHSIPFFHKRSVGNINFTCKWYKMKNDKTYSKVSIV